MKGYTHETVPFSNEHIHSWDCPIKQWKDTLMRLSHLAMNEYTLMACHLDKGSQHDLQNNLSNLPDTDRKKYGIPLSVTDNSGFVGYGSFLYI